MPQDPIRRLHRAIMAADARRIDSLIEEGGAGLLVRRRPYAGARLCALGVAVREGHRDMIDLLLRLGADPDALVPHRRLRGLQPLACYVAGACPSATLARLIHRGAHLDAVTPGNGTTALHHAAADGPAQSVALLLGAGVDLEARGPNAYTALHFAASRGAPDTLKALVEAGADLDARTDSGGNALHVAVLANHPGTLRYLIEAGVPTRAVCNTGETPLQFAHAHGRTVAAEVLEAHARTAPLTGRLRPHVRTAHTADPAL